jgi:hypothetical protein
MPQKMSRQIAASTFLSTAPRSKDLFIDQRQFIFGIKEACGQFFPGACPFTSFKALDT